MLMLARYYPIILLVLGIIAVFTNLLQYVIMAIAYLAIAILEVTYFIISIKPFVLLVFLVFFIVVDCIPFIAYSLVFIGILLIITLLCLLVAFANWASKGSLKSWILCQNSPAAWYQVPGHHLLNRFERGLFCSKPCKPGFAPNELGNVCNKLSINTPSYCPQAQVMRVYTGEGKNDIRIGFGDIDKRNMKYLLKVPEKREEMLLNEFINRTKYMDRCNNPDNPYGMKQYEQITLNICSNINNLKNDPKFSSQDINKIQKLCNQAYCNSSNSYPFCNKLSSVEEKNFTDIIKNIVYFLIAIIVFAITITFILFTARE